MLPREAKPRSRAARLAARPLTARLAGALALAALVAGGCGGEDGGDAGDEPAPGNGATELTVTLDAAGDGETRSAEVSCGPGTANEPAAACEEVSGLPEDPADPVPPQTPCTELYGGPDTVSLEGTLRGESVDTVLTRRNGCEIERFDRFTPLLRELFEGYRPGGSLRP